ncbi:hypothetical protein SAMN02746095_01141 [Acidocella aminolytica 101 = DSM 11237]|nr:hypothetical protein SAMN02746095_01141 [Acidocella aminolytica 101 = DSM 11237]
MRGNKLRVLASAIQRSFERHAAFTATFRLKFTQGSGETALAGALNRVTVRFSHNNLIRSDFFSVRRRLARTLGSKQKVNHY